ncbi:MAG: hypothetical protein HQL11_04015 [Candidatus Omnitrophica bacterium]|nr:hypothetical protein [Candidatus Omnitrophota bacterium]
MSGIWLRALTLLLWGCVWAAGVGMTPGWAAELGSPVYFETRYADVYYTDGKALGDFLWRISGRRFYPAEDNAEAVSSVDYLVDRVQSILDMRPDPFKFRVDVLSGYTKGDIAAYLPNGRSIKVYADRVTDGVFAHEVAHAVMDQYFESALPRKVQEILAQYVDRHLWEDY